MFTTNSPRKTGIQSLLYNAGFLVFSRFMEKVIRFVYLVILARWFGPELLGLYNYALAWYLVFLPMALWGLGVLLSIYIGRKPENAEDIVGATLVLRLFTTAVAAFCCFAIGFLINDDLITRCVIGIFVIALVGRSLALWGRSCFVAVERSHYAAGLEVGFRLAEVVCGLTYLLLGGGVIGVCIIHSTCWVVEGTVAFGLVRNRLRFRKIFVPWSCTRQYAIEALPIAANAFLFMALLQSGFIILKHFSVNIYALGYYTVAFQLVANTVLIPRAFGRAALPILSRAHGRETGETIVFLEAMIKISALCSAALTMLVIVYDTTILRLLFGQKYLGASDALIICAIAMVAYYALSFANNVINAGNEYVLGAVNNGVASIVNIVVSLFLVASMGEQAPALGLLAGASTALMLHLTVIHRRIRKISWWCAVIKPYVCVILAVSVTWNLRKFGCYGLGAGLVVLGASFATLRIFTPQEKAYFAKIIPSLQ